MTTLKGLTMVAALLAGGASLAMAQKGPPTGSNQPPVGTSAAPNAPGPAGGPYLRSAAPEPGIAASGTTLRHHASKHSKMYKHSSGTAVRPLTQDLWLERCATAAVFCTLPALIQPFAVAKTFPFAWPKTGKIVRTVRKVARSRISSVVEQRFCNSQMIVSASIALCQM